MSATSIAKRAYAPSQQSIRTPRSVEFEVMARTTHRLKAAIVSNNFNQLAEALYDNRILWNTFAADVASSDNGLDADLKARIFYLAEFTSLHTQKVLQKQADAKALLEINATILAGLQVEGQG